MQIDDNQRVKCCWCNNESTASEWSENTYNQCQSRKHRRAFRPLDTDARFNKPSKFYYRCPKCGMWSRGDQLRATIKLNDDTNVELGGTPLVKLIHNDNPFSL